MSDISIYLDRPGTNLEINLTPFMTDAGISIRESAGGDFSGGSFQIITDTKPDLKKYDVLNISVSRGETGGFESEWYLSEYQTTICSSGLFLTEIVFVEFNRRLEEITMPGYCLTQPLDSDTQHKKSLYDSIRHVLIAAKSCCAEDVSFVDEASIPTVFKDVKQPPITRKGQTLYYALRELSLIAGYVPAASRDHLFFKPLLKPQRHQYAFNSLPWSSYSFKSGLEYNTRIVADVENSCIDTVVRWPKMLEQYAGDMVVPINGSLELDGNLGNAGFKLPYDIDSIERVVFKRHITIWYYTESSYPNGASWEGEFEFDIPPGEFLVGKPEFENKTESEKARTLFYERGNNVISLRRDYGPLLIGVRTSGGTQEKDENLYGEFGRLLQIKYKAEGYVWSWEYFLDWFEQKTGIKAYLPHLKFAWQCLDTARCELILYYKPVTNMRFCTEKPYAESGMIGELYASESSNFSNFNRSAQAFYTNAKNSGNEQLEGMLEIASTEPLPGLSDRLGAYYITNLVTTYRKNKTTASITASKHFPNLTAGVALEDVVRVTEVPTVYIERNLTYSEYVCIHLDKNDDLDSSSLCLTVAGQKAFFGAFKLNAFDTEGLGLSVDKLAAVMEEEHLNYPDGVSSPTHHLSAIGTFIDNSVIFHAKFLDNIASDYEVENQIERHTPYTHKGYVDTGTFDFYHVNGINDITSLVKLDRMHIDKDPGEQISLTYQLSTVSLVPTIMPGSALCKYNGFNQALTEKLTLALFLILNDGSEIPQPASVYMNWENERTRSLTIGIANYDLVTEDYWGWRVKFNGRQEVILEGQEPLPSTKLLRVYFTFCHSYKKRYK